MSVKIDRTGSRQVMLTFAGVFSAASAGVNGADDLTQLSDHYGTNKSSS